jgi:transposase
MNKMPNDLPNDIDLLKKMLLEQADQLSEKDAQIAQWKESYERLMQQWRLAQHRQFGKRSEQSPGQGELFDEAESVVFEAKVSNEADSVTEQADAPKRNKPKRKPLPKDLPRKVVELDLSEAEKVCECCQGVLHRIGEDRSERLEFIPAKMTVIETIRPKYGCRHCEQNEVKVSIKQAPQTPSLIPKGIATASLLSQVVTSKYQFALPLYRQEALFKQLGIELSRQTLSSWVLKSADALAPLYQRLKAIMMEQPALHADETPLNVVKEDRDKCYMWVYCSGTDGPGTPHPMYKAPLRPVVLYEFQKTRQAEHPKHFLNGYSGYLQVDGYAGYEQTKTQLVGCWAHARRKFMDIEKSLGKNKGKTGTHTVALNWIQKLYAIESRAAQYETAEEAFAYRREHAIPVLNDFKNWLEKTVQHKPPTDKLTSALNYCLNQWDKLVRYVDAPYLNIDNNRAERAIKPFVIGRKNWLCVSRRRHYEVEQIAA